MKNTNAKKHMNATKKLAVVVTTLTAGLFSLTSNSAILQASELVKVEPTKQVSLYQDAKESLALSFDSLTISHEINDVPAKNTIAKQQSSADKNIPITLTKVNLVSE